MREILKTEKDQSAKGWIAFLTKYDHIQLLICFWEFLQKLNILENNLQKSKINISEAIDLIYYTNVSIITLHQNNSLEIKSKAFFDELKDGTHCKQKLNKLFPVEKMEEAKNQFIKQAQEFKTVILKSIETRFYDLSSFKCFDVFNLQKYFDSKPKESDLALYGNKQIIEIVKIMLDKRLLTSTLSNEEYSIEWNDIKKFCWTSCINLHQAEILERLGNFGILNKLLPVVEYINTFPIGTVDVERGFSKMNWIKNELRNRMKEDLLGELMMITINGNSWDNLSEETILKAIEVWKSKKQRKYII